MEAYPVALRTNHEWNAGILITALSSNTPARFAGLHPGDLILEINHARMKKMEDFRSIIDRTEPGASLPLTVYRDGQMREYHVAVGREIFRTGGVFIIGFPFIWRGLDLWPNPNFSLILLGYQRERWRTELGSVQETYRRNCDPKNYQAVDPNWRAWLVIMELSTNKKILSQETVSPPTVLGRGPANEVPD
jgi:hypothetical protein